MYDSGAVHQVLIRADDASGDELPFPESPEPVHRAPGAYSNEPLVLWRKCFQIPEKLIRDKKFACSISTNGVDVSIHCARPKPDDEDDATLSKRRKITTGGKAKTGQSVQRCQLRQNASYYTRMAGIDPGKKIACGGVIRTSDEDVDAVDKRAKNQQQRICLSSTAFRYNSGFYKREKQRVKLTGTVDSLRQNLLATERFLGLNTKDPGKYEIVTEYRLRQFKLCQSTYEKRAVTRLSWQKKWRTQQATDRLVNYVSTGVDKQMRKPHARKRRRKKKKPADDQDAAMTLVEALAGNLSIDEDSDDSTGGAKAETEAVSAADLASYLEFEFNPHIFTKTRRGERQESALPGPSTLAEARQKAKATLSSTQSTKRKSKSDQPEVETLVVLGQFNIPRHTKGRPGAPLTKLLKRFTDRAHRGQKDIHVVFADEFRTTINCSQCNRKCTKISTGKDRYLFCKPCRITWNRDVNAGQNILNLGLVRNGLVPDGYMPDVENFSRSRRVAQ